MPELGEGPQVGRGRRELGKTTGAVSVIRQRLLDKASRTPPRTPAASRFSVMPCAGLCGRPHGSSCPRLPRRWPPQRPTDRSRQSRHRQHRSRPPPRVLSHGERRIDKEGPYAVAPDSTLIPGGLRGTRWSLRRHDGRRALRRFPLWFPSGHGRHVVYGGCRSPAVRHRLLGGLVILWTTRGPLATVRTETGIWR